MDPSDAAERVCDARPLDHVVRLAPALCHVLGQQYRRATTSIALRRPLRRISMCWTSDLEAKEEQDGYKASASEGVVEGLLNHLQLD